MTAAKSLWLRLPIDKRAGTQLDWRAGNCEQVYGPRYMQSGMTVHGTLDHRQRVYQSGGEYKNFYYQAKNAITLPLSVWQAVKDKCEWIEMIDHELNHCYRVRTSIAAQTGFEYETDIKERRYHRFAVPRNKWERSEGPIEPERSVPTTEPTVPVLVQGSLFP